MDQKENFMNILDTFGRIGSTMFILLAAAAVIVNLLYMKWPDLEFKIQMWIKRHEKIAEPVFIIYVICCFFGVAWTVANI